MLEVHAVFPAVHPCAVALRAVLGPPVPSKSWVKVSLSQLEAPRRTSIALLIDLGSLAIHERHCLRPALQMLVLYRELDVLQLVRPPPLGKRHAAHGAHHLELAVSVDQVAVRLPAVAQDEALDRPRLQHALSLALGTHPWYMDEDVLAERNQPLSEVLSPNPGKRRDAILADHPHVDDEGAVLDEPRKQRMLHRKLGAHALLQVPLVRAQDALELLHSRLDLSVA